MNAWLRTTSLLRPPLYCSKRKHIFRFVFAVLFQASNIAWCCVSTRQHWTLCSTLPHAVPCQQQCPNSPLAFHVPRFRSNWTHLGRVGQMCLRLSEHPFKCASVVQGTPAGVGGHPCKTDSQPDPVHANEMLSSYWFWRRTHTLLICLSLSFKILTDWTVFGTRSVKIMSFDQNQF